MPKGMGSLGSRKMKDTEERALLGGPQSRRDPRYGAWMGRGGGPVALHTFPERGFSGPSRMWATKRKGSACPPNVGASLPARREESLDRERGRAAPQRARPSPRSGLHPPATVRPRCVPPGATARRPQALGWCFFAAPELLAPGDQILFPGTHPQDRGNGWSSAEFQWPGQARSWRQSWRLRLSRDGPF